MLTFGYEGRSLNDIVLDLLQRRVNALVDVRWSARSRKADFNKSRLEIASDAAGLAYYHDRRLGTPPEMLSAARQNGYDFDVYRDFLNSQHGALEEVVDRFGDQRIALMCYEADYRECHRAVVAEEVSRLTTGGIEHT